MSELAESPTLACHSLTVALARSLAHSLPHSLSLTLTITHSSLSHHLTLSQCVCALCRGLLTERRALERTAKAIAQTHTPTHPSTIGNTPHACVAATRLTLTFGVAVAQGSEADWTFGGHCGWVDAVPRENFR